MSQRFLDSPTLPNFPNTHAAATFSLPDPHKLSNQPKSQGAIPISCFSPRKMGNKARAALKPLKYPAQRDVQQPSFPTWLLAEVRTKERGFRGSWKVFLALLVPLGARTPGIPERLCGAQPNKETAGIPCWISPEVLPLLRSQHHLPFCSSRHLWKPVWAQVSRHRHPQRLGKVEGLGRGVSWDLGLPAPRIVRSIPGKGRAELPKHNADLVVIFVSPPAPPRSTPR